MYGRLAYVKLRDGGNPRSHENSLLRDDSKERLHFMTAFHVIDQTRGRVFPPISKHLEVGWKNEAQPSFLFNQLQGVWK